MTFYRQLAFSLLVLVGGASSAVADDHRRLEATLLANVTVQDYAVDVRRLLEAMPPYPLQMTFAISDMTPNSRVTFQVGDRIASFRPTLGRIDAKINFPLDSSLRWLLKIQGRGRIEGISLFSNQPRDMSPGAYVCDDTIWPPVGGVRLYGISSSRVDLSGVGSLRNEHGTYRYTLLQREPFAAEVSADGQYKDMTIRQIDVDFLDVTIVTTTFCDRLHDPTCPFEHSTSHRTCERSN